MATEIIMTQGKALDIAIEKLQSAEIEPEVLEILAKIKTNLSKTYKKEGPSKTKLDNQRLAQKAYDIMPPNELISLKWVTEHVAGIMTTQKATYVMKEGVELGLFEVAESEEGKKNQSKKYLAIKE